MEEGVTCVNHAFFCVVERFGFILEACFVLKCQIIRSPIK